jgi:hypothetical protein
MRTGVRPVLILCLVAAAGTARAYPPPAPRAPAHLAAVRVSHLQSPARPSAAPVAVDDSLVAFTDEDYQKLFVLDNDTDSDGDPIYLYDVSFASHGSAACCTGSGDFYAVDYKPFAGFSGTDTFTYTVTDGNGGFDTAAVTVTVAPSGQVSGRHAIYGGVNDRLRLVVTPNGGAPASPNGGVCNGSPGLAIEDGVLAVGNATYFNPFDLGVTIWINGVQLPPQLPMSATHHNLASGPHAMAGFNVGLAYFAVPGSNTLRTLLSLSNPTGASKPVTVTLATNVGSDAFTGVRATSSGDLTFTTADRWVVTSDHVSNPGYVVNTHVLFGPGSPPVTPDLVSHTVFGCPGTDGILAQYHLTVPGSDTRRLLFFNQFHHPNSAAIAAAAEFNATPVGLLGGLSNNQLSQVVNWIIPPIDRLFLPVVRH